MMADHDSEDLDDIDAWKEVHRQLILAVAMTQDTINAEKAKRRFLLEEIYLNVKADGTLAPSSKWSTAITTATTAETKQTSSRHRKKKKSEDGSSSAVGAEFSVAKSSRKKATQKKQPASSKTGSATATATANAIPPKKRIRISSKKIKASKAMKTPAAESIVDQNDEPELAQQQEQNPESPDMQSSHESYTHPSAQPQPPSVSTYPPESESHDVLYPSMQSTSYVDFSYNMDLNATAAAVAVASQVAATAMADYQFQLPPPSPKEEESSSPSAFHQSMTFEGSFNTNNIDDDDNDVDADTDAEAAARSTIFASSADTALTDQNFFSAGASESLFQQMLLQQGGCDDDDDDDDDPI